MALVTDRLFSAARVPVLMYHSIGEDTGRAFRPFVIPTQCFADQMAYLHEHGYTPITVGQMMAARVHPHHPLPDRPVVLTFDDAFADFHRNALPIMTAYNFAATLYVPTAYVGGTSRWLARCGEGNRPLLTSSQLREVARSGVECGAHTHTHAPLDMRSAAMARQEIETSKVVLEQYIGQSVTTFAYPFGYYDAAVQRLVAEAGFTSACAVRYAYSSTRDDRWALARLRVGSNVNIETFEHLLEGKPGGDVWALRVRSEAWRRLRLGIAQWRATRHHA
jgi:peptidoglycan/xylan/chitin deacetylase (PgdA/CDA1 family)